MSVHASATYVRISPRKVRLVVDQVRGAKVADAEKTLRFMQKRAAEPVLKLVLSAVANAEHNNKMKKDNLYIKTITADEGFTIKRYRARAFGRAGMIRKRTSRLHVELDEIKPMPVEQPKKADKNEAAPKAAVKAEEPVEQEPTKEAKN